MARVFTRVVDGELPGRLVWPDDDMVACRSIGPLDPGHTLVARRDEVDHRIDLDPATWQRVSEVTHTTGQALQRAFDPPRVGTAIARFDGPHCRVHVLPLAELADLDSARLDPDPDTAALDAATDRIRAFLPEFGHAERAG